MKPVSRRDFLKFGGLTLAGAAGATALGQRYGSAAKIAAKPFKPQMQHGDDLMPGIATGCAQLVDIVPVATFCFIPLIA